MSEVLSTALLLIQIAVIIGFSRLTAIVFRRIGQPAVVGEMVAGIALGPTLFGWLAPEAYARLFPVASLGFLSALSQSGLVIFTFLIGVRFDFAELRRQSRVAVVTSNVSVIVPFVMGVILAQYLFGRYGTGNRIAFTIFIGTAMSVTAFPVLARILMDRNLLETRLGALAITCAAVDDITAWILLALTVAFTKYGRETRSLGMMLVNVMLYAVVMLVVGWVLSRWAKHVNGKAHSLDSMLLCFVLALFSAAAAEWIGVHSLVGAFAGGLATPRKFRRQLIENLEGVTMLLLIPLFFALTGIRTNLMSRIRAGTLLDLFLILFIAIASKWGGTMIGASLKSVEWCDACKLGVMMNTRGLVELVVLNVGLTAGVISPVLFSMMVFMTLTTTFMATPLLDYLGKPRTASDGAAEFSA